MLRNIDPILGPDALAILRAMGHGDQLAIVDGNYPAQSHARRLVRFDGISASRCLRAVLGVLPLDTFTDNPALAMQVVGDPAQIPPVLTSFQETIDQLADHPARLRQIDRFAFYDVVKQAYAVFATGEDRLYGNVILTKGVITPPQSS